MLNSRLLSSQHTVTLSENRVEKIMINGIAYRGDGSNQVIP
jgi:hypothetical protein